MKVTNEVKIFGIWSEVFKGFVFFVFFFGLSGFIEVVIILDFRLDLSVFVEIPEKKARASASSRTSCPVNCSLSMSHDR